MKCVHCGHELDPGATFCGNCGQPVAVATPVAAVQVPAAPTAAVNPATFVQQPMQTAPAPSLMPAMAGGAVAAPIMPMAMPMATAPGSGKAIAALVLGILGLVGCLIPILGLAMGVTALVLGLLSLKSAHRRMAITGIVTGSISIVASIGLMIYTATVLLGSGNGMHSNGGGGGNPVSSQTSTVDTPCYTTAIDSSFTPQTTGTCGVKAVNADDTESYDIESNSVPGLTAANFKASIDAHIAAIKAQQPGVVVNSETSDQWSSSPAYKLVIDFGDGNLGTVEYVYHKAPNGDNIFSIDHISPDNSKISLDSLKSNWKWK